MKQQFKTLAVFLLSSMLLFSCSKDDAKSGAKSKTDLLTSAPWKMAAYTINPAYDWEGTGVKITDIFATLRACDKDDQFIFKANGEVIEDPKSSCSDFGGGDIETLNWKFTNNETGLTIIYNPGEESSYKIVELTTTTLKLSVSYIEDGVNYTDVTTYTH